jgi:hypothetical protein
MVRASVPIALAVAVAAVLPASPASAGGTTQGCLDGSANQAVAAGDTGALQFSDAFFRTTFSVDVSTDGFAKRDLTISIEAVCGVPKAYESQAVQLAGSDGIAVISSRTRVYKSKHLLTRARRTAEIDGADTMHLKVRLARPARWRAGEDDKVPTFSTLRADITD